MIEKQKRFDQIKFPKEIIFSGENVCWVVALVRQGQVHITINNEGLEIVFAN